MANLEQEVGIGIKIRWRIAKDHARGRAELLIPASGIEAEDIDDVLRVFGPDAKWGVGEWVLTWPLPERRI